MTKKSLEKLLPKKVLEKLPEKTKENLIIAIQKNSKEFNRVSSEISVSKRSYRMV